MPSESPPAACVSTNWPATCAACRACYLAVIEAEPEVVRQVIAARQPEPVIEPA
jgi:hypothetical protein